MSNPRAGLVATSGSRGDNSPVATGPLPRGTLTFVFTDIEGSTKLLNALGTDRYHEVLEAHTDALRRAFAKGHEVRIEGDALFVVFATGQDAIEATTAAQRTLGTSTFPHGAVVRVRMGMHTGEGTPASERAGADYVGIDVHRAARIAAVAHGGQVLLSAATRMLAGSDLPSGVALRDLGEHQLKDLAQPERIFQLVIDGCPSEFPALRSLDRIPNNLPTQLTTFIGREKEIRQGLALLDGSRLLTLTGPGGTGKTRLSLQLAAEAAAGFPDGAFWVQLAPISDPELVPSTIAHALGVQVSGSEMPLDRVTEHLRAKKLLLVLDNFEQILPAATTVSSLLADSPQLKVLASSRAPLRITGEQEFPIPPLELPDPERLPSLEVLAQSDAVRLFIERARAVRPDFMVTAENASAVAEICFRLDGLPVALAEDAAPRLQGQDLKRWLDLLETEHDNLRAALERAITAGRADEAVRLVHSLWRFWQARGHLGEGLAWTERVLAIVSEPPLLRMKALSAAGGLAYWMADQPRVSAYYREAYDLAQAHGDIATRAQAAYDYAFTFQIAGVAATLDYETGRRYLEESLVGFRALGDRAAIGRAAWGLAVSFVHGTDRSRDELLRGREYALEALREHRALGTRNVFDEGWDLHALGLIALKLGELDEAAPRFREALELFVAAADSSGIALQLGNVGEVAKQRGDLDRHDVLVGAWSALAQRAGIGIVEAFAAPEGRATAADIPSERRPALERGLAMTTDEAVRFALQA